MPVDKQRRRTVYPLRRRPPVVELVSLLDYALVADLSTIDEGDAATAGTSLKVARADHQHAFNVPHLLVPSQTSVTGVTETLVGTSYLIIDTYDISAFLGEETGTYNGILRFRLTTDSSILTTLTATTAQPANVSSTGISVTTEGWYEMFLYSDNASGVAICEGIRIVSS